MVPKESGTDFNFSMRAHTHTHTHTHTHNEMTHQHEIMCHSFQHNGLHTEIGCIGLHLVSHDDSIITGNHDSNGDGQLLCCLSTGFRSGKKATQFFEVSRQGLPP
jgi:hypothetical protein